MYGQREMDGAAFRKHRQNALKQDRLSLRSAILSLFALLFCIVGLEYFQILRWMRSSGSRLSPGFYAEMAVPTLPPSFQMDLGGEEPDSDMDDLDTVEATTAYARGHEVGEGQDDALNLATNSNNADAESDRADNAAELGSTARLPRTSSRTYNELDPSRKYFIYSPSGGWNNQLACLLNALVLAEMSGRDLVIPPMARHSDLFNGYLKVEAKATAPMDMILDLDFFEQASGVRVVPLNVTLEHFYTNLLPGSQTRVVSVPKGETLIRPKNRATYKLVEEWVTDAKDQIIYYRGPFFSRHWADWEIGGPRVESWKALRYAPYLVALADEAKATLFPRGYNALHVRMGDYLTRLQQRAGDGSKQWVKAIRSLGWSPSRPIYVASDMSRSSAHFTSLLAFANKTFFMSDLEERGVLEELKVAVPHAKLRNDIFGLVEQLICADARNFIGSYFSTFSLTIMVMRGLDDNSRLLTSFGGLRKRHKPAANT
ncbi:Hypothetical Protein FCC1311_095482 [Hondaea fermentalgiana]|uniref:GDP-fucose protein O-fucosyltransferase 2 n=1 Tax=Hondaea fermentalgiana TaxID=2315210 RepID=A0A2R5GRV2_9STRA|nr:Hypothetical Protein FCC1311_095482 [Hondaea fermentalgiana]|eukprot:GBG33325.1 Hypothetical Protein FCC1311_095482 [Hondaea fermentalgiana]